MADDLIYFSSTDLSFDHDSQCINYDSNMIWIKYSNHFVVEHFTFELIHKETSECSEDVFADDILSSSVLSLSSGWSISLSYQMKIHRTFLLHVLIMWNSSRLGQFWLFAVSLSCDSSWSPAIRLINGMVTILVQQIWWWLNSFFARHWCGFEWAM